MLAINTWICFPKAGTKLARAWPGCGATTSTSASACALGPHFRQKTSPNSPGLARAMHESSCSRSAALTFRRRPSLAAFHHHGVPTYKEERDALLRRLRCCSSQQEQRRVSQTRSGVRDAVQRVWRDAHGGDVG